MKKTNFTHWLMYGWAMIFGLFALQPAQAQCPVGQSEITITFGSGSWNSEIGWELVNTTTGLVEACEATGSFSAGSVLTVCVTNGDTYEFVAYDSFGDGWNGATVEVDATEDGSVNGEPWMTDIIDPQVPDPCAGGCTTACNLGGAPAGGGGAVPTVFGGTSFVAGPPQCDLLCDQIPELTGPGVIEVNNEPGECGANVTITNPDVSGVGCTSFTPILQEGFDAGTMPAGWAIDDGTGDPVNGYSGASSDGATEGNGIYFDSQDVDGGPDNPNFSGNRLEINDDDFNNLGIGYVVTPTMDVTGYTTLLLSFDWQNEAFVNSGATYVDVWDGSSWVNILFADTDDQGSVVNMDLTPYINSQFAIRFGYDDEGEWAWAAGFDNIVLQAPSGAPVVTNDYNGTDNASDFYPVGTTTVTFHTTDVNGAPVSCSIDVIVHDVEPPVLTGPADMTVDLGPGECGQVINYDVTATDNCPVNLPGGDVTTMFLGGNGQSGNMFTVQNNGSQPIMLTSFDVNLDPGTWNMEVYYTKTATTHVGVQQIPSEWELLGTASVTSAGGNQATPLPVGGLVLNPGESKGIYVTVTNGTAMNYTNGSSTATDGTLLIDMTQGNGVAYPFGTIFTPRQWNGTIYYDILTTDLPVTQTQGLPSGSEFPIGVTTNCFEATDAAGNTVTYCFTVTVNEYPNAVTQLVCNDQVQISLDEECQAAIGADDILEGGPYGCYDDYIVMVLDATQAPLPSGNVVDASFIGNTWTVKVVDPETGNSCWSSITVEDKLPPIIECQDLVVSCTEEVPQAPIPAQSGVQVVGISPGTVIDDANPGTYTETIEVNLHPNSTIQDIDVGIDITHTWVGDLTITLTSPAGTTIILWNGYCGSADNLFFIADDEGTPSVACVDYNSSGEHLDLFSVTGLPPLSTFDGENPNGTWTFTVTDGFGLDGGTINNVTLYIDGGDQAAIAPYDACSPVDVEYTETVSEGDCSGPGGVIVRTWTATDASGNSASCTQTITIQRPTLADIEFPADVTVSCDDYAANPSIIDPTVTGAGEPTIDGIGVGTSNQFCDITCSISDEVTIPVCDGTFKVRRKWLCIDWCAGEEQEVIQLVKVLDEQGPDIANPLDPSMLPMQVTATHLDIYSYQASAPSSDPYAICSGHIEVPPAQGFGDNCSSISGWVTELWTEDFSTLLQSIDGNGGWFWDVPLHDNNPATNGAAYWVRYRAFDACGNESSTDLHIVVHDKIPPVAVCDEITELAINNSNANGGSCATLFAEDLDDGSYDNCGEVYFLVAKMTGNGASFSQDIYNRCYYPSVEFCCDEVGEQQVILLVLDGDPSPYFTSLNSPSLGCNGTPGLFLTQGWDNLNFNTCMVTVQVTDKIPPVVVCPPDKSISCDEYWDTYEVPYNLIGCDAFADFGSATAYDNCDFTMDYSCAVNLDQCGNGTITRTWVVDDGANATASCTQTISVYHVSDWYATFPPDITVVCEPGQTAGAAPTAPAFGEPTIYNETCELIAISYEDTYYPVVPDACYKLVRTWTVLNWCDTDPFGSAQTGTQIIKVIDNTPPTINGCDDRSFEELDNECGPVFADLSIEILDDCSNLFTVSWEVDLNSDGTVDASGTDTDVAPGTYSAASGDYPLGTHTATFQVMDQCGNSNACSFTFTITDGKKPTPYCVNGLVLEIMPSTGMVDVWASDFDAGSWDNCPGDLQLSLSADVNDVQRIYTCDDLGQNTIQLWVTDAAGNQDYCETFVVIQDNMGGCTGGNPSIAGAIATEDDEPAQDVTVEVNGQGNVFNTTMMTAADGLYSIEVPADGDYTVTPSNDADPLNGVSTFDLVLISKHILGVQPLDSPYKIIAADANRSNSVTTFDMVEIRKLILHINNNFPNNTSWRFVPKSHQFTDPMNPWAEPLPEVLNFNNVTADILDADFVAIKVGDVNGNAAASNFAASEDRTTVGKLTFVAKDVRVEPGARVEVPFTAKDFYASGYQFTLEFDRNALEFAGVEAGVANADNFGTALLSEGVLTASWNAADAKRLADNEVVFTLVFTGKAEAQLSDLLSISSRYTKAEAYNENDELLDVELAFTSGKVAAPEFALYQNTPNPFGERTVIGFTLPEATRATLTISDVTGKVLQVIERDFNKGYNEVIISRDELPAAGVLYYQLDTPTDSASRKMILID